MKCIPGECPPGQPRAPNLHSNLCTLSLKARHPRKGVWPHRYSRPVQLPPTCLLPAFVPFRESSHLVLAQLREQEALPPPRRRQPHVTLGPLFYLHIRAGGANPFSWEFLPSHLKAGWRAGAPTGAGKRHPTSHFHFGYETQESEHSKCATHAQEPTFPLDDPRPAWAYSWSRPDFTLAPQATGR